MGRNSHITTHSFQIENKTHTQKKTQDGRKSSLMVSSWTCILSDTWYIPRYQKRKNRNFSFIFVLLYHWNPCSKTKFALLFNSWVYKVDHIKWKQCIYNNSLVIFALFIAFYMYDLICSFSKVLISWITNGTWKDPDDNNSCQWILLHNNNKQNPQTEWIETFITY